MLFAQTAAPTGWTKSTTHDNKALRVVSGSASSGGSVAFTTAFASQAVTGTVQSYTLQVADIPIHSHSATTTATDSGHSHNVNALTTFGGTGGIQSGGGVTGGQPVTSGGGNANISASTSIGNTGGGGGHAHGFSAPSINLAVQYVDVIIATKD
jgi:microcystin-dependent protein